MKQVFKDAMLLLALLASWSSLSLTACHRDDTRPIVDHFPNREP